MISNLSVLFLLILFVIQTKSDGYFPFPKTWDPRLLLCIVLIETLFLLSLVMKFSDLIIRRKYKPVWTLKSSHFQWFFNILVFLLIFMILFLHNLQAVYFSYAGYNLSMKNVFLFFMGGAVPPLLYFYKSIKNKVFDNISFLWAVLCTNFILKVLPLIYFPVTAKRSDMLPVLQKASNAFFNSQNIYQYFLLDNNVLTQNVRLPGLIFIFMPCAIFKNFDPRIIVLIFEFAVFSILIHQLRKIKTGSNHKMELCMLITCFFMLPYWHFRHELYEVPFWTMLMFAMIALRNKRLILLSFCLGLMISSHQWGWLFFPYFCIYILRHYSFEKTSKVITLSLLAGGVILIAGIGFDFNHFYEHVFKYYNVVIKKGDFYPMSLYFSYAFQKMGMVFLLRPLQIISQIVLIVISFFISFNLSSLACIMALSLTFMLLFNPVAWTYQYLLVVFLLLLGMMFYNSEND